ncbi:aminotransferase class I/II-fold pyridoxal phosphate-dependent enzyme [bacterium]|nr:aminotransferase class I/II-fold pyridoxal phosphate-dependent enzyme [bacterium]
MGNVSDFRSDTVTRPTEAMRKAMAEGAVGDDVLGDDPTVQKLESMAAQIMDKEGALFVPSGTMGNSIATKVWTSELEEVILEERSHIFNMESTHMTFISRVTPRPLPSNRGAMEPQLIQKHIRQPSDHIPKTSLICIENTHNNWSGAVVPLDNIQSLRKIADEHNLKLHFDGARVFNASQASGVPVKEYARLADSLMFCLSKGLSAPVGSLLTGPRSFIQMARRVRKALGGGMRQVGVLAASGIVALQEMVERLEEDHARAQRLAQAIADLPGIILAPQNIQTNIIIFGFDHPQLNIPQFLEQLKNRGILALPTTGGIRFVLHKDIDDQDVNRTISAFKEILSG